MIKFSIKTDKGIKSVSCPTSWDEITFEQFLVLEEAQRDIIGCFGVLTGLDLEWAQNSKDKKLEDMLVLITKFLAHPPDWENITKPKRMVIGSKICQIPVDIKDENFGQKIMASQLLATHKGNPIDVMLKVVAIYMQPKYHGKFDNKKLPEVEALLLKCLALDLYAVATFFLSSSDNLMRFGMSDSFKQLMQKRKQGNNLRRWKSYILSST